MRQLRAAFATAIVVGLISLTLRTMADVKISQEPVATTLNPQDMFLLDQTNSGAGTFTTKTVSLAVLATQIPYTNAWPGPSNNVDVTLPDSFYSTVTPCQFNGVINKQPGSAPTATVDIYNASATNVTLYLPGTMLTREGVRSYTIPPANELIISVRYEPGSGRTNSVTAPQS